jgi:hypothetical protein
MDKYEVGKQYPLKNGMTAEYRGKRGAWHLFKIKEIGGQTLCYTEYGELKDGIDRRFDLQEAE